MEGRPEFNAPSLDSNPARDRMANDSVPDRSDEPGGEPVGEEGDPSFEEIGVYLCLSAA
jgi:hypothetical protein